MNEEQRLSYLRSMGYQVYYPRAILPGAKPSPHYDFPELSPAEKAPKNAPKKALASISSEEGQKTAQDTELERPLLKQSRKTMSESSGAKEESSGEPGASSDLRKAKKELIQSKSDVGSDNKAVKTETTAYADQLKFSLQYYAIDNQLAIINEEPFEVRGRQAKESLALLKAILNALKPGFDSPLQSESFAWPIAEGLNAAEPERAARLALQGFINQRQSQEGFGNLVVFTAQLGSLFNVQSPDDPFGDVKDSAINCQMTLTHSLHSMLAHPLLKREVWSHLQPLLKRLQG